MMVEYQDLGLDQSVVVKTKAAPLGARRVYASNAAIHLQPMRSTHAITCHQDQSHAEYLQCQFVIRVTG